MKQFAVPVSLALFLIGSGAQAMESPQTRDSLAADIRLAAESHEQKCNRWADLEDVKSDERAEYVKYCMIDLSVPEKPDGGDDD